MKLRLINILAIVGMGLFVLSIAVAVSHFVILENYREIEERLVIDNIERARYMLDDRISFLENTAQDWSFWDDTYDFVSENNTSFITSNMHPSTFNSLDLSAIFILDTSGNVLYSTGYDPEDDVLQPVKPAVNDYLTRSPLLFSSSQLDLTAVSGIAIVDGAILMLASSPITTSDRTGPISGSFIMVRYLDDTELVELARITKLKLELYILNGQLAPEVSDTVTRMVAENVTTAVDAINPHTIYGYVLINDINDISVLVIRSEESRVIYNQGIKTLIMMMVIISLSILLAGIVTILLQHFRVVSKLEKLKRNLQNIVVTGDFSRRFQTKGADEISDLSNNIDRILEVVDNNRTEENRWRQNVQQEIQRRAAFTRELVHELKSPITPILSSSELLAEGLLEEPWQRLATNVYKGALDMNDRLDDLIDLAKGEIGDLSLRMESLNMIEVIRQMAGEMMPLITSRSQQMLLKLPADLPPVRGDEIRLRQILRNLISNATKFTPEKGVITIAAVKINGKISVLVSDTGRGISKDKLARIYDPDYRPTTPGDHQSGLGLGLRLSKKLIELHGGSITVESELNTGTVVSFTIPIVATTDSIDGIEGKDNESIDNRR